MANPSISKWQSILETVPTSLKPIQKYIRIANDIERIDPVIAYWTRFHALDEGFKLDKSSPDAKAYLSSMLNLLESFKQENKANEKVSQNLVAQANFENFVLNIFNKADSIDRSGNANMNTVKMFFMASVLFEVLSSFGSVPEEINEKTKYSKFKAAYIQKCLKSGEVPIPGPLNDQQTGSEQVKESDNNNIKGPQPSSNDNGTNYMKQFNQATTSTKPPYQQTTSNTETKPNDIKPIIQEPSKKLSDLVALNGNKLEMEDMIKAQKYIKYATASLTFDDIRNTVDNLEKAIRLLKTGVDE